MSCLNTLQQGGRLIAGHQAPLCEGLERLYCMTLRCVKDCTAVLSQNARHAAGNTQKRCRPALVYASALGNPQSSGLCCDRWYLQVDYRRWSQPGDTTCHKIVQTMESRSINQCKPKTRYCRLPFSLLVSRRCRFKNQPMGQKVRTA